MNREDGRRGTAERRGAHLYLACALLVSAGLTPLGAQESGIPVGSKAPVVTIQTLDGNPAPFAQFIGKGPVLIEFWATWCSNCKELEPALLAAQKRYASTVQFVSVAVSVNESPELVRRYVERHGLAGAQLYDRKGDAVDAYDVPATSFVVVIDRLGKVVYTGLGGQQDLNAAIKKAF